MLCIQTSRLLWRRNNFNYSIIIRWPFVNRLSFNYYKLIKDFQYTLFSRNFTKCDYYTDKLKNKDFDISKADIIGRLNFKTREDALPFYNLPIKTLLYIYKTTKNDEEKGYCKNRLYYISNHIKQNYLMPQVKKAIYPLNLQCPPSALSELLVKRSFIYSLSFEWLESSLNVLLEFNITGDRIMRDLWIFKYHHKTIHDRLSYVKNLGIDNLYPWMVRCTEDILKRFITISQETKTILGDVKSTKIYLANRLNTSPEYIDEIYHRVPTLKTIRVTKVKKFLDFLISEGFCIEDIASRPRVLSASQKTVKERIDKLRNLGVNDINLNIVCRSRKDFYKFCNLIEAVSK